MFASWFYFLLFSFLLELAATTDDSVVTNSPLHDTNYRKSIIANSELTKCNVDRAGIKASVGKGSTIAYSYIRNSTIINSNLNATYSDCDLDETSTTIVFNHIDRYYFNRVFDSHIENADFDAYHHCISSDPGYNSTVQHSSITNSKVGHSKVSHSKFTEDSTSCSSIIGQSDLFRTHVSNSVARKLKAKTCTVSNAVVEDSLCEGSRVVNTKLYDCTVFNSKLSNSVVSDDSEAVNVIVQNSVVSRQSKVVGSEIKNSKVSNSELNNCIVINSNVNGKVWDSIKIVNGMIHNKHFY